MSMSKKDFIALADELRPVKDQLTPEVLDAITHFCKLSNPAFMYERWTNYLAGTCGKNGWKTN